MNPPSLPGPNEPTASSPARPPWRNWWVLLVVLLAPALLTLLTAGSQDAWPFFTFFGSMIAGLVCGFMLSVRICRTTVGKVFGGLALAIMFTGAAFALCCAGCAIGGAKLNFH